MTKRLFTPVKPWLCLLFLQEASSLDSWLYSDLGAFPSFEVSRMLQVRESEVSSQFCLNSGA